MNYHVVMFDGEPVAVSTTGVKDAEDALIRYKHERYIRYQAGVAAPLSFDRWEDQFIARIRPVESGALF